MSVTIQSGVPASSGGGGGPTLGTDTATTSGSTKDFTGIPATAKEITLSWRNGSTNGAGAIGIQLGDSGGVETSGYTGVHYKSTTANNWSASALIENTSFGSNTYQVTAVITLVDPANNTWQFSINGVLGSGGPIVSGGFKSLSATLDRVRLLTADTFDAGSVNIAYV